MQYALVFKYLQAHNVTYVTIVVLCREFMKNSKRFGESSDKCIKGKKTSQVRPPPHLFIGKIRIAAFSTFFVITLH